MKHLVIWLTIVAVVIAAPVAEDGDGDNCSQVWITVDGDVSSTASASTVTPAQGKTPEALSASSSTTASSSAGTSGGSLRIQVSSTSASIGATATTFAAVTSVPDNLGGISTPSLPDGTPGFSNQWRPLEGTRRRHSST